MSRPEVAALKDRLGAGNTARTLSDARTSVPFSDIARGTVLGGRLSELSGRSVLVATTRQLLTAIALIEIDGIARRLLLCPPDLASDHRPSVIADAGIDAVVCDDPAPWRALGIPVVVTASLPVVAAERVAPAHTTQWLMLTSGTTGVPKIVSHTLAGLTGAISTDDPAKGTTPVWATFYDIRRYGGLQIFLRAMIGGGAMVLSEPGEAIGDHLQRLTRAGVTHISGTPSHWRKALMSTAGTAFVPHYIRLSGEIADQAILDSLRRAFPQAAISHAYASTEAGVGFVVNDGREGFPASLLDGEQNGVEMKVEDGSLRIRSARAASHYVGRNRAVLSGPDGFVDTGDMVERRGERCYFVGRRGGIINVGGLKVHPEEVEAVINRRPEVRMSRVKSRRSPITGAIVIADVVLADPIDADGAAAIRKDIIGDCRRSLAAHKVPATISFVLSLDVTASGKLARHA